MFLLSLKYCCSDMTLPKVKDNVEIRLDIMFMEKNGYCQKLEVPVPKYLVLKTKENLKIFKVNEVLNPTVETY